MYILVFTARINEKKLAVTYDLVICGIVNDQGIGAADLTSTTNLRTVGDDSYPEATTGTYAGRCAPPRAQMYSKCAATADSDIPGRVKRIV